jgi:hypothetical protein
LQVPDSNKFKEAMVLEINQHTQRHNWVPLHKDDLPAGTIVLLTVGQCDDSKGLTQEKYTSGRAA